MENQIENLAFQIANAIYPHNNDQQQRDRLFPLLIQFAEEIVEAARKESTDKDESTT